MVPVGMHVQCMLSCGDILVVGCLSVFLMRQAFIGVSIRDACREATSPTALGRGFETVDAIGSEVDVGQGGRLVCGIGIVRHAWSNLVSHTRCDSH